MKSVHAVAALIIVALASLGCAGKGDVSGKVSFNGKPVAGGTITFVGADKLPHQGPIKEDGSYQVPNIPTGEVKVGVDSPNPGVQESSREKATRGDRPADPVVQTVDPKKWFPIPGAYRYFDQSGLTYTIKSGKNEINVELKPK